MSVLPAGSQRRRVRVFHFCSWAARLEDAAAFLERLPACDVSARTADANNPDLVRMARLDCDWHAQITRALAAMAHAEIDFLPARVLGVEGFLDLAKATRPPDEEWWLIFQGHTPQQLAGSLGKLLSYLGRNGTRVLYYAFDEASRAMPAFAEIAPHLSVFIHDEAPLNEHTAAGIPRSCLRIHRSWVANVVPFAAPFNEAPEEKIFFLGSKLGLTDHRKRQIAFLKKRFGDQFVAIHDHSVGVDELGQLSRFKVSVCPEGRKFGTPAMANTHTDRPFWSGCLGLVPVSEDSRASGRLQGLSDAGLIVRYRHGDLDELGAACERALVVSNAERRRIYDHFNRHETVGTVVADAIAAVR